VLRHQGSSTLYVRRACAFARRTRGTWTETDRAARRRCACRTGCASIFGAAFGQAGDSSTVSIARTTRRWLAQLDRRAVPARALTRTKQVRQSRRLQLLDPHDALTEENLADSIDRRKSTLSGSANRRKADVNFTPRADSTFDMSGGLGRRSLPNDVRAIEGLGLTLGLSCTPVLAQQTVKHRVRDFAADNPALSKVALSSEPQAFERSSRALVSRIDVGFDAPKGKLAETIAQKRAESFMIQPLPPGAASKDIAELGPLASLDKGEQSDAAEDRSTVRWLQNK
jgi:hypothetical protein